MNSRSAPLTDGSGRAERPAFSRCIDRWALQYGIESAIEGPVDGIDGVKGVHGLGLACAGIRVVAAVESEGEAAAARHAYRQASAAAHVEVRVSVKREETLGALPMSDLAIAYDALSHVRDWRRYLAALRERTRKILVVVTPNPRAWSPLARLRARPSPHATSRTEVLAPVLWSLGHVREHVYFDAPTWPDAVEPWWPGALAPLLPKARMGLAGHHAFVVDVRPRTPQGRRKLEQALDPTRGGPVHSNGVGAGQ